MQLDINSIQVRAGGPFDGTTHTGTLTITEATNSTLAGILVDGQSQGGYGLGDTLAEIELVGGNVVGGFMSVMDSDGNTYTADIGQGGRVNVQAGRGFRIDGHTFEGVFAAGGGDDEAGVSVFFGNVDVTSLFGANATNNTLEGSFLLASFNPNDQGIDTNADLDVFIIPTPGTVALAGLAGVAVLRRKR